MTRPLKNEKPRKIGIGQGDLVQSVKDSEGWLALNSNILGVEK